MNSLTLSVSLADQRFDQVKSLGILTTSLGLCRALSERPELSRLTLLTNPTLRMGDNPRVQTLQCVGMQTGKLWRLWWDQIGVYRAARRAGNDWLLLPKGYASFVKPCPVRLACYVHDIGPEYYRQHHPKGYPPMEVSYFYAGLRAAIRRSQLILVNTHCTADEIRNIATRHGLRAPRIEVAGIGFERPPAKPAVPRTRIVTLANRWPHKRTDLALDFLARWQTAVSFAGPVDWIGQLPEGLTFPGFANWRLHGRLPQDEFDRFMAEARAFVYVSDYEGFGMPPVETVLAGACPVYSDLPSSREVMQGAGYPFSNLDYASFAAAMDQALGATPDQIRDWSERLLARHNWRSVAERTIRAFQNEGTESSAA